jgi:hypothetical protein
LAAELGVERVEVQAIGSAEGVLPGFLVMRSSQVGELM